MIRQLDRLTEMADLPTVSLRIVPFGIGMHDGLVTGTFVLLRFPRDSDGKDREPPTVYVDGFTGSLYLDKPHEVERYSAAFERLWSVALSEQESVQLIQREAEELRQ